ncbi:BnaCnng52290D [Brassica napus]|uniref:BnaCnng52290D protein n=1 Tax=Brassica napus TaxID=3708 RepID=A0A078JN66_BRANA|nr:BnaCnng52290D [Brassica napus]
MEGPRLPPSATFHESDDDKSDDPPSAWHRPTSSLSALPSQDPPPHHWRNHSLNLSPILATPPRSLPPPHSIPELETYVVQVPRDQVYWTPPPEHAKYVEERRNNPEKNKRNGCSKLFAVKRLTVKPSNIEITLRAENPTSNMRPGTREIPKDVPSGVWIRQRQCKAQWVDQERRYATSGIKTTAGPVKKNKEVVVTCDVKVKGLLDAKKVEIVSENCESEFKN